MTNVIVFIHWFTSNRSFKRKKIKAFGLAFLTYNLGRVAHFVRNPALPKDQPLRGRWVNGMNINICCYKFDVIPNSYIICVIGIRYDVFEQD